MAIFTKLVCLYEKYGYQIDGAYTPNHYMGIDPTDISFMYLTDGDKRITSGGGISPQELSFMEDLCQALKPKNIFIIGNAWGWSALGLAMITPEAKVVAIDICADAGSRQGLEITNRIAKENNINAIAVMASSPVDVPAVIHKYFEGQAVDLFLIDGLHKNDVIVEDFKACWAYRNPSSIFIFHDVINWRMGEGMGKILSAASGHDYEGGILFRTTSGIGMMMHKDSHQDVKDVYHAYSGHEHHRVKIIKNAYELKIRMGNYILGF